MYDLELKIKKFAERVEKLDFELNKILDLPKEELEEMLLFLEELCVTIENDIWAEENL